MRRYIALSTMTLMLGTVFVPAAQASPQVSVQIGPSASFAPYGASIWIAGHYVWTGFGNRWVPGAWVARGHGRYERPLRFERERFYRERDRRWDRGRRDRDRDRDRRNWRR
jgi:hypothetical protein